MSTNTILQSAAKLWWDSLTPYERQAYRKKYQSAVLDNVKLTYIYQKEHPTKPVQELEKNNKFEYKILKQWENVGFSDEDNSRDCYMAGAKYARMLLEEQNQVLVESIERMNEEYVKLKKENEDFQLKMEVLKTALVYCQTVITNSEEWWLSHSDRGGFDMETIENALQQATK